MPGLFYSLRRLHSARDETLTLDALLATPSPDARIEERLLFLVRLLRWVRAPIRILDVAASADERASPQQVRIRFLLRTLDRNERWKLDVARTLRTIVRDTNALDLFAESGMPAQLDVLGELRERLIKRILPAALDIDDLAELFDVLFPRSSDARWIATLDDTTEREIRALFWHGVTREEGEWNSIERDLQDALLYITSQVRALGMSKAMRARLGDLAFRRIPFFGLSAAADDLLAAIRSGDSVDRRRAALLGRVVECENTVRTARAHLVETGVSVAITYLLTRISAQLIRIRDLVELMTVDPRAPGGTRGARFVARLVTQSHERRGLWSLLRQSSELWALKIVERSAHTGEHYITRSRREYLQMLRMASIGGALTAFTVIAKFGIASLHFPVFYEGIAFALNYSVSFLLIQFFGATLATKQPANTAPAIAARLEGATTPEGLEAFIDEVAHLIRSQVAGILGNVICVVPVTIALDYGFRHATGRALITSEKAEHTLHSLSLLGPSFVYAAFTGLLLFLGGVAGAAADNWVVYRRIRSVVGTSILFTIAFGRVRAGRIGAFVARHFSGVVSNVSLALMLALAPIFFLGLHLPVDVRHVTLSTGSIAGAIATLGVGALASRSFWLAVVGVVVIGAMNLLVSFAFAMRLALSARAVRWGDSWAIGLAVLHRMRTNPMTFLLPIRLPDTVESHVAPEDRASEIELSPPAEGVEDTSVER